MCGRRGSRSFGQLTPRAHPPLPHLAAGMGDDVAGRSFHHGRFVQKLRQAAAAHASVTVRQGYVRRLVNGALHSFCITKRSAWKEGWCGSHASNATAAMPQHRRCLHTPCPLPCHHPDTTIPTAATCRPVLPLSGCRRGR